MEGTHKYPYMKRPLFLPLLIFLRCSKLQILAYILRLISASFIGSLRTVRFLWLILTLVTMDVTLQDFLRFSDCFRAILKVYLLNYYRYYY